MYVKHIKHIPSPSSPLFTLLPSVVDKIQLFPEPFVLCLDSYYSASSFTHYSFYAISANVSIIKKEI
jgi:hypothetical protein